MPFDVTMRKWRWTTQEVRAVEALRKVRIPLGMIARAVGCEVPVLLKRYGKEHFDTDLSGHGPSITEQDRRQATVMLSYGIPHTDVMKVLDIKSETTFRREFAREIATATIKANAAVTESLFKQCRAGDVVAMKFWLKVRAGWRETQHVHLDGIHGVLVAPATVTPDQWIAEQMAKNQDHPPGIEQAEVVSVSGGSANHHEENGDGDEHDNDIVPSLEELFG
jgi:hypothetical protein